jgi:hypothetical protein
MPSPSRTLGSHVDHRQPQQLTTQWRSRMLSHECGDQCSMWMDVECLVMIRCIENTSIFASLLYLPKQNKKTPMYIPT